jgi:hypothetical protein
LLPLERAGFVFVHLPVLSVVNRQILFLRAALAASLFLQLAVCAVAQTLPQFDFTGSAPATGWRGLHHISALTPTAEGLEISINGDDPYFSGPARDYPENTPLWLVVRLKSEQAGGGEVFYFRNGPDPAQAVRFDAPAGQWTEARVPLPPLGAGYRLRLDPPGHGGKVLLAGIRFEKRVKLPAPSWPAWIPPQPGNVRALVAGGLELHVNGQAPLGIELRVDGQSVAFAHPRPRIAYVQDEQVRWVDLAAGTLGGGAAPRGAWAMTAHQRDADGALWTWRQTFRVDSSGCIAVESVLSADRDRAVAFAPMHLLVAGEKSFGRGKKQGLFAGLEYLDDEPSSSEADIEGPESKRQVPAAHKITFPLMAVQAGEQYVGLIWEEPLRFAALFDSPDRTFGSGGHVMGVIYPGSDGGNREEGSLLPYRGELLKAGQPLVSRAWFIGGRGSNVVPAVQQYVKLRGWPRQPDPGLNLESYSELASRGWLESKCRVTNLYRHAVWPGFNPQPAADAAVYQTWLANHTAGAARSNALLAAARDALAVVKPQNLYHSAVSHVRGPVPPLVFGSVNAAAEAARQTARGQLARFAADHTIPYRAGAKGGVDYGRTHFAPDANGLTALAVATALEAAAFAGDRELIAQGIVKLRALDKFHGTVPRGAQTWEVPLHTPDILASAHLVRAFTLGWELTGERQFLDAAIYWAWTGVPFVYLVNPTGRPVGPYSTIAVLGATSWKAPVWFGRPVQWCGLVYAEAIYRLAPHDAGGPWRHLADDITRAGLQHTWRADDRDRVGLLPDFYELKAQTSAGPAINPGTVASGAARVFGGGPLHDFRAFRKGGLLVHAPGEIVAEAEREQGVSFTVRGWPREPYFVLVAGFTNAPSVKINGAAAQQEFHAAEGRLILKLDGVARVEIAP